MFKKLGTKKDLKKFCEIKGRGLNGYKYKKNTTLNAGNSGFVTYSWSFGTL